MGEVRGSWIVILRLFGGSGGSELGETYGLR
jgi:hypothetical protein